jgi:protocatechuate 3,4-dioxygenase beta subunit
MNLERLLQTIPASRRGLRLELHVEVVDRATGAPVPGVPVEIWHCAADGDPTGVLRETEPTGPDGVAAFHTIYPGWYEGRTAHIDVRVAGQTGELFFSDSLTDRVAELPAYSCRTVARTRNRRDRVYTSRRGARSLLSVSERHRGSLRSGVVGRITLEIDPEPGAVTSRQAP